MGTHKVSQIYKNAFTEVSVILEHLRKEDYDKISGDLIKAINENKNNDYFFELENGIELKKQNLMPETRAILFNIFYDYYADEKQKAIIQDIWNAQNRKEDLEKQGKFDVDVFKNENNKNENNKNENIKNENNKNDLSSSNVLDDDKMEENKITVKKENIIRKIINKIKSIFKK